jgi:hypothetical protein
MTRRHIVLSALLATAALAAAPAAQAKQISGLTVCGADGCGQVDRAIGQALHELGGAAIAGSPRAASHYRLVLKIGDGRRTFGTQRLVYVPGQRAVGGDGGWTRVDAGTAAKLDRAVGGRAPIAAGDFARTVAIVAAPGTSLPPEVVPPPATDPAPSGDTGMPWWVFGIGALVAIIALGLLARLRRGGPSAVAVDASLPDA